MTTLQGFSLCWYPETLASDSVQSAHLSSGSIMDFSLLLKKRKKFTLADYRILIL